MGICFDQAFAEEVDPVEIELANGLLAEASQKVEDALGGGEWLVGGRPTAADLCCAPLLLYGALPDDFAPGWNVVEFFRAHLALGAGRERTRAWLERVMAFESQGAPA